MGHGWQCWCYCCDSQPGADVVQGCTCNAGFTGTITAVALGKPGGHGAMASLFWEEGGYHPEKNKKKHKSCEWMIELWHVWWFSWWFWDIPMLKNCRQAGTASKTAALSYIYTINSEVSMFFAKMMLNDCAVQTRALNKHWGGEMKSLATHKLGLWSLLGELRHCQLQLDRKTETQTQKMSKSKDLDPHKIHLHCLRNSKCSVPNGVKITVLETHALANWASCNYEHRRRIMKNDA